MIAFSVLRALLGLFLLLLLFRLIMEYVFMFARSYRPSGFMAMALEVTYTVTDPPYKALRRVIPPLRLGNVALDLAFTVLIMAVFILLSVLPS